MTYNQDFASKMERKFEASENVSKITPVIIGVCLSLVLVGIPLLVMIAVGGFESQCAAYAENPDALSTEEVDRLFKLCGSDYEGGGASWMWLVIALGFMAALLAAHVIESQMRKKGYASNKVVAGFFVANLGLSLIGLIVALYTGTLGAIIGMKIMLVLAVVHYLETRLKGGVAGPWLVPGLIAFSLTIVMTVVLTMLFVELNSMGKGTEAFLVLGLELLFVAGMALVAVFAFKKPKGALSGL